MMQVVIWPNQVIVILISRQMMLRATGFVPSVMHIKMVLLEQDTQIRILLLVLQVVPAVQIIVELAITQLVQQGIPSQQFMVMPVQAVIPTLQVVQIP